VDFLKNVTPNNQEEYLAQLRRFNLGIPGEADCPVFDGMFQYCQARAGMPLPAAAPRVQAAEDGRDRRQWPAQRAGGRSLLSSPAALPPLAAMPVAIRAARGARRSPSPRPPHADRS
jgi:hypothetical protein